MIVNKLRFRTYLSPSIPTGFYEVTLKYLEQKLGIHVTLDLDLHLSGPLKDKPDPFFQVMKLTLGIFVRHPISAPSNNQFHMRFTRAYTFGILSKCLEADTQIS